MYIINKKGTTMMKRKNILSLFVVAAATLTLFGCKPEQGADGNLILYTEGMGNGAKVAMDGTHSYWASGDKVDINGTLLTVTISDGKASVEASAATNYYGVYGATITNHDGIKPTALSLPSSYNYATTTHGSGTYQNLQTPMVAYGTGSPLLFKHLTAALGVQVVNYLGFTVRLDSIVVSSDKYALAGPLSINPESLSVSPQSPSENRRVALYFNTNGHTGEELTLLAGDSTVVFLPLLPVGNDNHFTVQVYSHKVDQPDVKPVFEKTQAGGQSDYSLARAVLTYARATFGGLFSVSSTKRVIISQGNLQYQASTGTWRFAETQYGYIGNAAGNTTEESSRSGQSDWIDLFGYGTSGYNNGQVNYMPYVNSTASANYYTGDLTGNADWGYNAISNGGNRENFGWYTLSQEQWTYLLKTRTCTSSGLTGTNNEIARYSLTKIGNQYCLVIYPDNYNHPAGAAQPSTKYNYPTPAESPDYACSITSGDCDLMTKAGAIFLPYAGYRSNVNVKGCNSETYYWSSTYYSSGSNAYAMRFKQYTVTTNGATSCNQGFSVRLVKDI